MSQRSLLVDVLLLLCAALEPFRSPICLTYQLITDDSLRFLRGNSTIVDCAVSDLHGNDAVLGKGSVSFRAAWLTRQAANFPRL